MKTSTKPAPKAEAVKGAKGKVTANAVKSPAKTKDAANVIETLVKKEQRFLYRFQLEKDKLTAAKAKQKRQKIRRLLSNFDRDIRMEKNTEKRAEAIKEFNTFYKENFILNDYSVKSLTDSRDSHQIESYTELLKRVQDAAGKAHK